MIRMIEGKRDALRELCIRFGVQRLELFGSAARGGFDHAASDIDFLVTFRSGQGMNAADQYFGLLEELERLFGRPVDLVMERAMRNPYFIRSVERNKALLYAA